MENGPDDIQQKIAQLEALRTTLGNAAVDAAIAALHASGVRLGLLINLRGDLQMRLLVLAESYEDIHAGRFTAQGEQPGREVFAELRTEADRLPGAQCPFHWELEFPEVFIEEAGMSGIDWRVSGIGYRVSGIGYRPTRTLTYPTYPMQPPDSRRWWATRRLWETARSREI